MTVLALQARIDSSRLPGKALLSLGGRPLILRVMEAFNIFSWDLKVLACPEDSAASFAPLAEDAGFTLIPGPKEDVLGRYCLVIRKTGAERIVRATGDNPFVFADAAVALNGEAESLAADYAGYSGLPYGAGVESIASEALLRAEKEAQTAMEREHVCPYIYTHPELFSLHRPLSPLKWQGADFRITVDTPDDYKRAETLDAELFSLPPEKRNLGENVIKAYKNIFNAEAENKT